MLNSFFNRIKSIIFSESWADAVFRWLYNLPLPLWVTCLLLFILCGSASVSLIISDNRLEDQELIALVLGVCFIFSYGIFVVGNLINDFHALQVNSLILQKFISNTSSPASGVTQVRTRIFYLFRLLLLLLVVIFYSAYLIDSWTDSPLRNIIMGIFVGVPLIGFVSISFLLGFRITKILSTINQLKSQDIEINLFDLSPYYQLSQFTQKIALYLLPISFLFLYGNYRRYINLLPYNKSYFDSSEDLAAMFVNLAILIGPALGVLSIFVFVAPVIWIRARIISEKDNLQSELGIRLKEVLQSQDQAANDGNFSKVNDLKFYADSLISRREFIAKISNWPWETRVFKEFSAAILIPVGLSLVQVFINRLVRP